MTFPFNPIKVGDFCYNCECWSTTVIFPFYSGPYRNCSPEIKDTIFVTIPSYVRLPALATVEWSADDDILINGESLNGMIDCGSYGGGKCCATLSSPRSITIDSHQVQVDLLDTVGVYWYGNVKITIC